MDVKVIMTNGGGDIIKTPKDLSMITGFENMPLLALFGGNVEESTPILMLPNAEHFDWWGNNLLIPNNQSRQFNSETERLLNNIALNSAGLVQIEETIKRDLQFLSDYVKITVVVKMIGPDRILIGIKLEQKKVVFLWDNTNRELVDAFVLVNSPDFSGDAGIFEIQFEDVFE